MTSKKDLTERDIVTKYIIPAIEKAVNLAENHQAQVGAAIFPESEI